MSLAFGGGGRGGGGFGGFPYRSPHQQNGGGRGGKRRPRKRKPPAACKAELFIAPDRRGLLIGKGGNIVKELTQTTRSTIDIPGRNAGPERPVLLRAGDLSGILHACWEIAHIALRDEEVVGCVIRFTAKGGGESGSDVVRGRLHRSDGGKFIEGFHGKENDSGQEGKEMHGYCLETVLDEGDFRTAMDNELFIHSDVTAWAHLIRPSHEDDSRPGLIVVFGTEQQNPSQLVEVLQKATMESWLRKCALNQDCWERSTAPSEAESSALDEFTVGTYNLLHPRYAEKYRDKAGVDNAGRSNWSVRCPAISYLLLRSCLDVYLLQEVDSRQMWDDLMGGESGSKLSEWYECVHFVHPTREARDGVAILVKRGRFIIEKSEMVPFEAKLEEHQGLKYMCAAAAVVRDMVTGKKLLIMSTHFYEKKSAQPQSTLLDYVDQCGHECDAVVWGGDCNNEYKSGLPGNGRFDACKNEARKTKGMKKIDWIFFTPQLSAWRNETSESFINSTEAHLELTGRPSSDHFGEAITLGFKISDIDGKV